MFIPVGEFLPDRDKAIQYRKENMPVLLCILNTQKELYSEQRCKIKLILHAGAKEVD